MNNVDDEEHSQYAPYEEYNLYLVWFCMSGLEAVIDIKDLDSQDTIHRLAGEPANALSNLLHYILLRNRFNNQRNYEVYSVRTSSDITVEYLIDMFRRDPQLAADTIREKGHRIYGDHEKTRGTVVIK